MESPQAKIRKITAEWQADSWQILDGIVYVTFNGVTTEFDLSAAGFGDWPNPDKPLTIVLEIPHP